MALFLKFIFKTGKIQQKGGGEENKLTVKDNSKQVAGKAAQTNVLFKTHIVHMHVHKHVSQSPGQCHDACESQP